MAGNFVRAFATRTEQTEIRQRVGTDSEKVRRSRHAVCIHCHFVIRSPHLGEHSERNTPFRPPAALHGVRKNEKKKKETRHSDYLRGAQDSGGFRTETRAF